MYNKFYKLERVNEKTGFARLWQNEVAIYRSEGLHKIMSENW